MLEIPGAFIVIRLKCDANASDPQVERRAWLIRDLIYEQARLEEAIPDCINLIENVWGPNLSRRKRKSLWNFMVESKKKRLRLVNDLLRSVDVSDLIKPLTPNEALGWGRGLEYMLHE